MIIQQSSSTSLNTDINNPLNLPTTTATLAATAIATAVSAMATPLPTISANASTTATANSTAISTTDIALATASLTAALTTCTMNHPSTCNIHTTKSNINNTPPHVHITTSSPTKNNNNNYNDDYPLYLSDNDNSGGVTMDCCCTTINTNGEVDPLNVSVGVGLQDLKSSFGLHHLSSRENGDSWMEENFSVLGDRHHLRRKSDSSSSSSDIEDCAEDFDEMLVFTDDVESEREKKRYVGVNNVTINSAVGNRSRSDSLMSNCTGSSLNNIFEGSHCGSFNHNNANHFSVIQSAITSMNTPLLTQQQLRLSPTLNDLIRSPPTNIPTSPPQTNRSSTPTNIHTSHSPQSSSPLSSLIPSPSKLTGKLNTSSNFIPIINNNNNSNSPSFSQSPPVSPKKHHHVTINLPTNNNSNSNDSDNSNSEMKNKFKRRASVPGKPLMAPLDLRSIRRSSEDNPIASDLKVMEKIRTHKKDLEAMKLKHIKLKQQMSLIDEGYTEVEYLSDDEADDSDDEGNGGKFKLDRQCRKLELDIDNLERLLSILSNQSNFASLDLKPSHINNNNNNNNSNNSAGSTSSNSGNNNNNNICYSSNSIPHGHHIHHHHGHGNHMHNSGGSIRSTSPRRDWRDWTGVPMRDWTGSTGTFTCSCGIGCTLTPSKKFSQELKMELRPLEIRAAVHTSPRRLNTSQISNSSGINQSTSSLTNFFDDTISEFEIEKAKLDQYQAALSFKQKEPICYHEYTIKRKLGEGKNSIVWEVIWKDARFALKQYKQPLHPLAKEESMKYVLGVNHFNVMVGIGYTLQPQPCLLMEYVDGTSLYDLLIRDGVKIEMPMFLKIGKELAAAMNHLHSMDIIHGNLTINSIYVDKLGNVKIGGIKHNSTDPNEPAIDPRYRAPEIIKSQAITSKVDVYSFSLILWILFTNTVPFKKFNDGTTVAVKVSFENLRPRIPMKCPLIIRKLINRCWSPNPESRPDFTEILRIFYHLDGKIFFSALSRGSLWTLDKDQEIEREKKRREKYDAILQFLQKRDYIIDFNDLQFGEKIGEGSFAKVWLGEWNGYKVAIKKLKNTNISEKFFLREVANLIKSHHPNVVMFMGIVTNPPCIITEYMSGGSLYDVLHAKNCKLDKPMMFKMMKDLAIGMSHLHSLTPAMLHRDLTSKNILLDEFQNVKISDFGLSKQIEEEMTLAGICNPRWRPPEITKGIKNYCEKVDVYSFGLVIYEIYTGKVPFENLEGVTAAAKSAYENLRPQIPDDCPLWLRKLISNCWAGEAIERPSFTEIVNILNQNKDQFVKKDLYDMISGDDENDQVVEDNIRYDETDES